MVNRAMSAAFVQYALLQEKLDDYEDLGETEEDYTTPNEHHGLMTFKSCDDTEGQESEK